MSKQFVEILNSLKKESGKWVLNEPENPDFDKGIKTLKSDKYTISNFGLHPTKTNISCVNHKTKKNVFLSGQNKWRLEGAVQEWKNLYKQSTRV